MVFQPCGNWRLASSSERDGEITTASPGCQFAGVAIFCLDASWSASRTRNTSSKFRPTVPGYKKLNFSCNSAKNKKIKDSMHQDQYPPPPRPLSRTQFRPCTTKSDICNDIPSLQAPLLPGFFFFNFLKVGPLARISSSINQQLMATVVGGLQHFPKALLQVAPQEMPKNRKIFRVFFIF